MIVSVAGDIRTNCNFFFLLNLCMYLFFSLSFLRFVYNRSIEQLRSDADWRSVAPKVKEDIQALIDKYGVTSAAGILYFFCFVIIIHLL